MLTMTFHTWCREQHDPEERHQDNEGEHQETATSPERRHGNAHNSHVSHLEHVLKRDWTVRLHRHTCTPPEVGGTHMNYNCQITSLTNKRTFLQKTTESRSSAYKQHTVHKRTNQTTGGQKKRNVVTFFYHTIMFG